jgi:hypothetical protein
MIILANLRFLTHGEGGRKSPIGSGYRAVVDFGVKTETGLRMLNDCTMTLLGNGPVHPGEFRLVKLTPLHPELIDGYISQGLPISLWEGKAIAFGNVTGIE